MSKQNISGIYAILNKINGKRYVGSSKDVYYRWSESHLPTLKNGNHHNNHLKHAWKKYGEQSFEFQVIEECSVDDLLIREGYWIEHFRSWEREYGYNITRIVDGKQVVAKESIDRMLKTNEIKDYWNTGTNGEILKLFKDGTSKNAISIKLGITRSAVYSCLEYHGLHINTGAGSKVKLTDDVKQQIVDYREEGKSFREICELTGLSQTQLYRCGLYKDGKFNSNQRSAYRTITPEVLQQAREIRTANPTMPWKDIADRCGVSLPWLSMSGVCAEFDQIRSQMTDDKKQRAIELRNQGLGWRSIAKEIGIGFTTLNRHKKDW